MMTETKSCKLTRFPLNDSF